jgi:hypothetical protein
MRFVWLALGILLLLAFAFWLALRDAPNVRDVVRDVQLVRSNPIATWPPNRPLGAGGPEVSVSGPATFLP